MTPEQRQELVRLLEQGEDLSPEWARILFPPEKREYELVYHGKEREEDIIANTLAVPLQPVRTFSNGEKNGNDEWRNMLIFGDNLQVMKTLLEMKKQGKLCNADGTPGVRLIYIDPPFGTGDAYDARGSAPAYSAKLQGVKYFEFLRKRLIFLRELLSDDGIIYVRIDYHFGHSVKIILDEVFNKEAFKNEIVINRTKGKKKISDSFSHMVDSVFFYSKGNRELNEISAYTSNYLAIAGILKTINDKSNDRDKLKDILFESLWVDLDHRPGERATKRERVVFGRKFMPPQNKSDGKYRHWIKSQLRLNSLIQNDKLRLKCKNCGFTHTRGQWNNCKKCKEDDPVIQILLDSEILADNWTDIPGYSQSSGYPTENSEELLERIISSASNDGDIVLDCFAGSGTTLAVADKLNRRWIGVDCGKLAIYTMQKRMLNLQREIGNKGPKLKPKPFILYNAGLYDFSKLKELPWESWRFFALQLFQCRDEPHAIGGIKLDGYLKGSSVLVFNHMKEKGIRVTEETVGSLHEALGTRIGNRLFIIAPALTFDFQQDYITIDGVKYYALRIPYSIINELHQRQFTALKQPSDEMAVNDTVEAVGFDFIRRPELAYQCGKTKRKGDLFEEGYFRIKKFKSEAMVREPMKKKGNLETLSMVMLDYDYDEKSQIFDLDAVFYAEALEKEKWTVRFPLEQIGKKVMAVFIDIYGNEAREVIEAERFGKLSSTDRKTKKRTMI